MGKKKSLYMDLVNDAGAHYKGNISIFTNLLSFILELICL